MVSTKVFKVDNISVMVFGNAIDGVISFKPPKAANREKEAIMTVEGAVGYNSKIIAGETTFTITSLSDSYMYLASIVDTIDLGTVIFSMPGATYTMHNAIISMVETSDVSESGAPEVTITVLYTRVTSKNNSYSE